jgi:uncharacterized protein involved in exopolysaccharide biosynthesis
MNTQTSKEITLLDFVKILVRHKWLMLIVFISVQVGSAIYSYSATPVYEAEVLLAAADAGTSGGGLSSLMSRMGGASGGLGSLVGRRDKMSQGIATMKSQQFIREFIEENNLLPILYADRWDSETSDWKVSSSDEIPRLSDGYKKFDNTILRIVENSKSGLVAMTIEWTDPDLAAKWANNLTFRLNEKLRSRAIREANQTILFLNKEAEKTRIVELQQAIYFLQ